jgi:hypothetical protein
MDSAKLKEFVKKYAMYIIIGCIGILLLSVGSFEGKSDSVSLEEYRDATETRIEQMCMQVSGIYQASVMVSFDDSVITSTGSMPSISGIAVVCRGSNARSRTELTKLLSSLYSLPTNKIYIVEGG